MSSNLTLVTALFDLGRGNLQGGFGRSFDHYKECFKKLLDVKYNLVIYCEPELNDFVWQHRTHENTRIVNKTLDDLRNFPFYQQVQDIRQDPQWYGQSGWIPDSTQAKLELYNPLVMSKQFFLNDATHFNFFDTKYFLWIDGGLANTVNLQAYINEDFERRITPDLNKMLYVCFPYDGTVEVHGFEKGAMNRMAGADTKWVARGGIFGGPKHIINEINDIYYGLLSESFNRRLMGTEESIFTIITYKHPEKVNVRMIEGNGLVYKYFEDLNNVPVAAVAEEPLAFYVLTYNLPKQFELWAKSFEEAFPLEFKSTKKYVINNSTIKSVDKEYKKLFKKYGFEEFKKDNIGINGGRQFAADHFLESGHEYMVFFEDDMLLQVPGSPPCKNGFTTYHKDLFDKAIDIVRENDLDYLKLAFSEFYGDNHKNWAWENLPKAKKDEYFPPRSDNAEIWKTKVHYTGSLRGLPYAVGEYHYCNWPILFTKRGTQRVFKLVQYASLYEQTWMSQTMMHMRDPNVGLRAGSLLATTINHNRVYHYDGKTRRENEHYTN